MPLQGVLTTARFNSTSQRAALLPRFWIVERRRPRLRAIQLSMTIQNEQRGLCGTGTLAGVVCHRSTDWCGLIYGRVLSTAIPTNSRKVDPPISVICANQWW